MRGIAHAIEPQIRDFNRRRGPPARSRSSSIRTQSIQTQRRPDHDHLQITQANSVLSTGAAVHAFNSATAEPDQLIVDADAFLVATEIGANGANSTTRAPGKRRSTDRSFPTNRTELYLNYDNTGNSSITIGAEGSVSGGQSGVFVASNATITNAGVITGGLQGIGIADAGTRTIKNSGLISGPKSIEDLTNGSNDTVINSGTIKGEMWLNGGTNVLTNSGQIESQVFTGNGKDSVTNSGKIYDNVSLGGGTNTLNNTGIIDGTVYGGSGNDQVTNAKLIAGYVYLEGGTNTLTNSGVIGSSVNGESSPIRSQSGLDRRPHRYGGRPQQPHKLRDD